jgi:hypothetical protein
MDGMRELLLTTHARLDGTRTPVMTSVGTFGSAANSDPEDMMES